MPTIKILAGDFIKQSAYLGSGVLKIKTNEHPFMGEKIPTWNIKSVEEVSHEEAKKLAGTVGMGILGTILLGPIGLLLGLFFGGRKNVVIFKAKLCDGRKFLGECKRKHFSKLQEMTF
jgi:hypothetical protein